MNPQISRLLYTGLFYLAIPFIYLRLYWRGRLNPPYRQRRLERLGLIQTPPQSRCIWIHAVSLGEVNACAPLVKALLADGSNPAITITTMTPTGSRRVHELFGDRVFHVYAPYDVPFAINRFLDRIKPVLYIIIETELWPNTIYLCRKRQIPVLLANARLSERSCRGYLRVSSLTQIIMTHLSHVAAHANADAQRFLTLGLPPERISITGSLKFDVALNDALINQANAFKQSLGERKIWVAASTHPGEESMILTVFSTLLKQQPDALLILVPRHPERFDEVYDLCLKSPHNTVRRSTKDNVTADVNILLGDTLGELMVFYGVSDVCFVGGSLIARGGHNVLEPALWGKPIVTGRHTFNFTHIVALLSETKGLVVVDEFQEMAPLLVNWLAKPDEAKHSGQANLKLVKANQGALQKHLAIITNLMETERNDSIRTS